MTLMGLFAMPMVFLEIIGLFYVGSKIREAITTGRMNLNLDTLPAQLMQAGAQVVIFSAIAPAYNVILGITKNVRNKPSMS